MSKVAQKWLKIARDELGTAKALSTFGLEHASTTLFLCQQIAEKSIKAYLAFENKKIKKIHDINELVNEIENINLKHSLQQAHFLTQYVAKFRYPQLVEEDPTQEDVTKALKIAESTYQTILKYLNG